MRMFIHWRDNPALFDSEKEKYLQYVERKYGAPGLEKYKAADKEQKGRCKICKRKMILVSDHKPGTKKFRGLLCMWCNSILGNIERMPWVLKNIVKYLKEGA